MRSDHLMMQNFCEEHWEKSYQCQHFYKVRSLWIQILMWSKIMITVLYLPLWCERVAPQNFYVPKTCSTCTMQSCTSLGECLVWPFWPKEPSRKRRWIIAHHTTALFCVLRSPALCTFPHKFSYGKYFFPNNFSSGDWRTIWQWSRPLNKVFLLVIITSILASVIGGWWYESKCRLVWNL